MDPVTVTAGVGAVASVSRVGYVWLSARMHRRRVELEVRREQEQYAALIATIGLLPPGSEITEQHPDGRCVTVKLPLSEAVS
ncbi:hypothetical protein [Streptomyces sp. TLI_146]|uniref:hypothetical protein n=1 Tax=Streptomyces sp. TLI_146 TaxID=1938858 RepID=UPI000CA6CB85|nr:hypothetical protein [Streptomyces sp. TLI_146]PKV82728.1 hypothetical protein BX283_0175 [Streptomyces sp. TLI_146]